MLEPSLNGGLNLPDGQCQAEVEVWQKEKVRTSISAQFPLRPLKRAMDENTYCELLTSVVGRDTINCCLIKTCFLVWIEVSKAFELLISLIGQPKSVPVPLIHLSDARCKGLPKTMLSVGCCYYFSSLFVLCSELPVRVAQRLVVYRGRLTWVQKPALPLSAH